MPTTRIKMTVTPLSAQAKEAAAAVINARDQMERLRGAVNRASSGDDWSAVEAELGLLPGKGNETWFLINNAADSMKNGTALEFAERVDEG